MPSGWKWTKLADVCYAIRGVTFKQYDVRRIPEKGTIPILRAGNILGRLNTSEDLLWVCQDLVSEEQKLQISDIVICLSSGSPKVVGKTAKLNESWLGSVGAFCAILRTQTPETGAYLAHWFQSQQFLSWRDSQARGANIQNLRTSELLHVQVPLPPLAEQKRIVSILNEQLAAVEQAKKAAEERLQAARALREVILHDAFESLSSQEWPRVLLGDLLQLRKEIVHPKDKPHGASTFVGLQHIESSTGKRLGQEQVEKSELTGRKPVFRKGDIVYGYLRPYLNKVWVSEFDGLCSVDQYVYKVNTSKVRPHFLATFMRSGSFLQRAPVDESPGQLPRIRTQEVASVWINLPPLDVQEAIESSVKAQEQISDDLVESAEMAKESIESIHPALLRRAFSGKI